MRKIFLVSCVSKKKPGPCPAEDIYDSAWFRKARAFVERTGGLWYILSAEHGLLDPGRVISTYNKTLSRMPIAERRAWAERVLNRLEQVVGPGDHVVILGGERYREFIEKELRRRGISVSVPMEGLRIGEQLRWLKEAQR